MNQMPTHFIPGAPPTFTTDLFMPSYAEGHRNQWEIRKAPLCLDHGYHSGLWLVDNLAVLLRHNRDDDGAAETWMSPSPHEIESQELGCRHAFGHTVVMGLGLGWVAVNAALNPNVTRVTVVEIDPDVIALVRSLSLLDQLPESARQKITILEADALAWTPEIPIDFLYADIWQKLGEGRALDQVRQMQKNIHARVIYFWGQELAIYNEMSPPPRLAELTRESVAFCVRSLIRLPLLMPQLPDYADMICRVIENRHKRGLPLRRD